jgi:hypothetical protein
MQAAFDDRCRIGSKNARANICNANLFADQSTVYAREKSGPAPRQKKKNDIKKAKRPSWYSLMNRGGLNSGSRKCNTISRTRKAATIPVTSTRDSRSSGVWNRCLLLISHVIGLLRGESCLGGALRLAEVVPNPPLTVESCVLIFRIFIALTRWST